jgi:hypothetical protein
LLNDQSGSVLGDSTVFSRAGCHSFQHTWVNGLNFDNKKNKVNRIATDAMGQLQ